MSHTTSYSSRKSAEGFTLLEVLLVIAIIGILAAIVIVALNPNKQLADARNAQRKSDVNTILNAVYQYDIDHSSMPPGTPTSVKEICRDAGACDGYVSLYNSLVSKYIVGMPVDPQATSTVSLSEMMATSSDRDFSADSGDWSTNANTGGNSNWDITGGAVDNAASTTVVALTLATTSLEYGVATNSAYQITFTINTATPGTLTPNIGGVNGAAVGQTVGTATQTQTITTAASAPIGNGTLMFVPDTSWTGTIDNVSVKNMTRGSTGYTIVVGADNRVTVSAPKAENGAVISASK